MTIEDHPENHSNTPFRNAHFPKRRHPSNSFDRNDDYVAPTIERIEEVDIDPLRRERLKQHISTEHFPS
jgi:hypothetical protein